MHRYREPTLIQHRNSLLCHDAINGVQKFQLENTAHVTNVLIRRLLAYLSTRNPYQGFVLKLDDAWKAQSQSGQSYKVNVITELQRTTLLSSLLKTSQSVENTQPAEERKTRHSLSNKKNAQYLPWQVWPLWHLKNVFVTLILTGVRTQQLQLFQADPNGTRPEGKT